MIKIQNLTKSYNQKVVVNHLNLKVNEQEAFALLGSNGAGKSTIIKMILGLTRPDEGEITIKEGKSSMDSKHITAKLSCTISVRKSTKCYVRFVRLVIFLLLWQQQRARIMIRFWD